MCSVIRVNPLCPLIFLRLCILHQTLRRFFGTIVVLLTDDLFLFLVQANNFYRFFQQSSLVHLFEILRLFLALIPQVRF